MTFLITLSDLELSRLEVIQRIRQRRLSVTQGASLLHISRSQMHRLLKAYDERGAKGLVSKKGGKPSNRQYDRQFRNKVINLVREHYADFGPTLAREKLHYNRQRDFTSMDA